MMKLTMRRYGISLWFYLGLSVQWCTTDVASATDALHHGGRCMAGSSDGFFLCKHTKENENVRLSTTFCISGDRYSRKTFMQMQHADVLIG